MSLEGNNDGIKAYAAAIYSKDPRGVLGPFLLGTIMDGFFMGLLLTQVVYYYRRFPRDSPWTRRLVVLVTLLSCLKSVQTLLILWDKFVDGFGDWINMVDITWTFYTEPVLAQTLSFCAQLFFSWRCFVLMHRNYYVLFGLLASMLCSLSLSAYVTYLYAIMPYDNRMIQRFTTPEMILNVVTDLLISVIVTIYLAKSRSGFSSNTDTALKKLLTVTWSAGIPPTISATLDMITFLTMQLTLVHVLFNMLTPRLYCFSMMYALNSRSSIRDLLSQPATFASGEITDSFAKRHVAEMSFGSPDALEMGRRAANENRYNGTVSGIRIHTEIVNESSDTVRCQGTGTGTCLSITL